MAKKVFPNSNTPIRQSSQFLPEVFKTKSNTKFLEGTLDPLIQPGVAEKQTGYIGRRFGKTFNSSDVYLETDETLRSRYQLEPGVTIEKDGEVQAFHDYLDFKNIIKFFGNEEERDYLTTNQEHYTWNPPIDWDKFINYREYFWAPLGPDPVNIRGQAVKVASEYTVSTSVNSWVFTPDGATNNPSITLYRGATYVFDVLDSKEGFYIRTNYDTGSIIFDPNRDYFAGQLAVYDDKLWKAKRDTLSTDGSSIDINSQDWELVDDDASFASLDYNKGIENNGAKNGKLTFTVPMDAPDVLYYQSGIDPNRLGRFVIADVDTNTFLDVDREIIGKQSYTTVDGWSLSNGMILSFTGKTSPATYAKGNWLVEGVGKEIRLVKFEDLVPPQVSATVPEVLFDNEGFDSQPFDDATQFPADKDYITVNKSSNDRNPWSRYNRWFHRDVLQFSAEQRNTTYSFDEASRAKRPIIEFVADIQLYQHGTTAKQTVDYVDDFTTDVFSNIEGSTGYIVDGESLFEGARVLITADTDILANNKIYEVKFIIHNGNRQLTLQETSDSDSNLGDTVLIRRGNNNAGLMYYFDGTQWNKSQTKTSVNQPPKFEVYDSDGVRFSDADTYTTTTFEGTEILSYATGSGPVDSELGFALKYENIANAGDIVFDFNIETESFIYSLDRQDVSVNLKTGFYKVGNDYENGWTALDSTFIQPVIETVTLTEDSDTLTFKTVNWEDFNTVTDHIQFFTSSDKLDASYTQNYNKFTFDKTFSAGESITIKVVTSAEPNQGYYEIPLGLEKNPLNQDVSSASLGQIIDHIRSGLEFQTVFAGKFPGVGNLRDLIEFKKHAKRFVKHAGIAPIAIQMLTDKQMNVVKSINHAKESYSKFKNTFLQTSLNIDSGLEPANALDKILEKVSNPLTIASPFADSDMIGTGAFTSTVIQVEDTESKTFAPKETFKINEISRKAVYIYVNDVQLLIDQDYTIDNTFGFIRISDNYQLFENDVVEIREYVSTAFSHVPPTPTAMGMYKLFVPKKFLDNTYKVPTNVIQGHDGSITIAFNDYRDDLLLELEYRIYNNIKLKYDYTVFDIDSVLGGYYGNAEFTKDQLDDVIGREFLRWISDTSINYTSNDEYFVENEPFTYNYSNMTSPNKLDNLPGWWRGVYYHFYDTYRPHTHPWEMQGFSIKPTWWEDEYGPAPYTNGNLILWTDIQNGRIKQGPRAGLSDRYARPNLLKHVPVDDSGNLLDPLTSGLATNFSLINNKGSFVVGDIGPVEYAWRTSSEYPFALITALTLMKPFSFILDNYDKTSVERNIIGQLVNKKSKVFQTVDDLKLPVAGENQTVGLSYYLSSYARYLGLGVDSFQEIIDGIQVRLSSRLSGFVDKENQKYLLDSKSPSSKNAGVFIPSENYNVYFNVSSPIETLSYSGVIIEKTSTGYTISGYDNVNPYFNIHRAYARQNDPLISVGGISEDFVDWSANQSYSNGQIALYRNDYYRAIGGHDATDEFDNTKWVKLAKLPVIGAKEAFLRKSFNYLKTEKIPYGTTFTSVQEVVDFLLSYEAWLIQQGFEFNYYDAQLQEVHNFLTSCKEFMFWTKQNWELGSLLTISPAATSVKIKMPIGVADSYIDTFYDYNILQANGEPFDINNINVNRSFQTIEVSTEGTDEGIYFLSTNYVLKEHVVIFDDRTVFNDVLFDKKSGYRQERIKTDGFKTTDWDGDYTSPGFVFDNVSIDAWTPFKDYKLGDIVQYRTTNYTALRNHTSGDIFDNTLWSVLDSTPTKRLIPNFDYRINQIEEYFSTDFRGIGETQKDVARHTFGYQPREYLDEIVVDETTQFNLYRGFIKEKGTNNALIKFFDTTSEKDNSVSISEEWAFRTGILGGSDQSDQYEINIEPEDLSLNPQPFQFVSTKPNNPADKIARKSKDDFSIAPIPFNTSINPTTYDSKNFLTAGYVKIGQTEYTIRNLSDIILLDVTLLKNNDHIWITFAEPEWNVLRVKILNNLPVEQIVKDGTDTTIHFGKVHNYNEGDYIGITDVENLVGIFKIESTGQFTVQITAPDRKEIDTDISSFVFPIKFIDARHETYDSISDEDIALLTEGAKVWVDENKNGLWEVVEKETVYTSKPITEYGITTPLGAGTTVEYAPLSRQIFSSMPQSNAVGVFLESSNGIQSRQTLLPPSSLEGAMANSFGNALAISPDEQWLAVGAPNASDVRTSFKGVFDYTIRYRTGDVVIHDGRLWQAQTDITSDSSTIDVYSEDWSQIKTLTPLSGTDTPGYNQQGVILLYKYEASQWNLKQTIASPRPQEYERFGEALALATPSNSAWRLFVGAPGSVDKGRVYIFDYNATTGDWETVENNRYVGRFDFDREYLAGDIVYFGGNHYEAQTAITITDGVSDPTTTVDWLKVDTVTTRNSLPQSVSLEDEGSTFAEGLISKNQIAELVSTGDEFGFSISTNYTGSQLIIGAPKSDDKWFPNYRGQWREWQTYYTGDVVRYDGNYYELTDPRTGVVDSSVEYTSLNEDPSNTSSWTNTGDSTVTATGKVFVYKQNDTGYYSLTQNISAGNLDRNSELDEEVNSGDMFGYDVSIDHAGSTFIVSSPLADRNGKNQGSAYIFDLRPTGLDYSLVQKLESFEDYPNEFFGHSVSISKGKEQIAVGAKNAIYKTPVIFDSSATSFDRATTTYSEEPGFSGAVYVFEKKGSRYKLTEKLQEELTRSEGFGSSVVASKSEVIVGSPRFDEDGIHKGNTRFFAKDANKSGLQILSQETPAVDLDLVKRISLYDFGTSYKLGDLQVIDNARLKISNNAAKEITFQVHYDPAIYSVGNDSVNVDVDVRWAEKNVGKIWWDLSTAKWLNYYQGSVAYRSANWNVLAPGASIDVYEWVESKIKPSEWSAIADTEAGLKLGISGQPKFPDDTVYSTKKLFNELTGQQTETRYYYWVRQKTTIPDVPGRSISVATVASEISNPANSNTFIALADSDLLLTFNLNTFVNEKSILNIEYLNQKTELNAVHREYQLITEGDKDSLPNSQLEKKWIDSLVGFDSAGNKVPDPDLPTKQKQGIGFRPRQSMFVDNRPVLKQTIEKINEILLKEAFADDINMSNLNAKDEVPSAVLNLYDASVDTNEDLDSVGTIRVKRAELFANIIDNRLQSVTITDPGYGYKVVPTVEITGDGTGAEIELTLDNQGRINSATVINPGKNYTYIDFNVRNFAVLVNSDADSNGYWSIYSWDDVRKTYFRTRSQSFDTSKYWSYADWWREGYSPTDRVVKAVENISQLSQTELSVGDLVRVEEYGAGDWAVLRITNTPIDITTSVELVGRANGTIQINASSYDRSPGIGFDLLRSYDSGLYDTEISKEIRNILTAAKQDIMIGDYEDEWNKLFFLTVRYVFSEQLYVDWAFKTSLVSATHNIGEFKQKFAYRQENIDAYLDFINEVKPYRTNIREYVSKYDDLLSSQTAITDFDLPPTYVESLGKVSPINEETVNSYGYPYKWWADNRGFEIVDIVISDQGEGYTNPPTVLIESDTGSGAKAQAFISGGKVVGAKITNSGTGYYTNTTVSLVGGNGNNTNNAKAVAIFGNSKARTFDLDIKFDRISKEGTYTNFDFEENFVASGNTSVFNLKYAPTTDKTQIIIEKNNQIVLQSEYSIEIFTKTENNFDVIKGNIKFVDKPNAGDIIKITYDKNINLFDAVNRINNHYNTSSGKRSSDLNQLMTGIDFGGVQIQGTTFDVTGGWDALPWFTDSWDSVESDADYYVIADGSTTFVTLPFVPADGAEINIYLKRAGDGKAREILNLQYEEEIDEPRTIRIDDPNWDENWDSSNAVNPNAQMPTFYGDGSTAVIEIGQYVQTFPGDTLIFRPSESDGSVTIKDETIIDTDITGGTTSAIDGVYQTAKGINAEDINIDGGKFNTPQNVPAPEENIPGQVLDTLSIKVFQISVEGAPSITNKVIYGDDSTSIFDIDNTIIESESIIIYKDGERVSTDNYEFVSATNKVQFNNPPLSGEKIEIISVGLAGSNILDYQEFVADGETLNYLTEANYDQTTDIFVSVNGEEQQLSFSNSSETLGTVQDRTLVSFGQPPTSGQVIKIVVLGSSKYGATQSVVKTNVQELQYDGSTRSFDVEGFTSLEKAEALANLLVEVNDTRIDTIDTNTFIVSDQYIETLETINAEGIVTNSRQVYQFIIGTDPLEPSGSILTSNVKVFVNGEPLTFIEDFVYSGVSKAVTIELDTLNDGDTVRIENDLRKDFTISGNTITIGNGVTLAEGDVIRVTWFSDYPAMDLVTDKFEAGKVNYKLATSPVSASSVWVYLNGRKLIQDNDYRVSLPDGYVYLEVDTTTADEITIITFGSRVFKLPSAFEVSKDMLNVYRYNRYSLSDKLQLASPLRYYDKTIQVNDSSLLPTPNPSRNVPGVIDIQGERIEYFTLTGNTLSNLRRGTGSTSVGAEYTVGTGFSVVGNQEILPYNDQQIREDYVSDGSSLLIGPLPFTPAKSTQDITRTSIPAEFGRCDEIEVFVAGTRLRKTDLTVFDETIASLSPDADRVLEPEFTVDGDSKFIRLSEAVPAGSRITIVKKTGVSWYDKGNNTATTGVTIIENESPVAKFIAGKTTELPE